MRKSLRILTEGERQMRIVAKLAKGGDFLASRRKTTKTTRKTKPVAPATEVSEVKPVPVGETGKPAGRWITVGWILLLVGGLANMLPSQLAPILDRAVLGVTLQMIVGILSVIFALYFLLGE